MKTPAKILLLLVALLAAGCFSVSKRPDLDLLYRSSHLNENSTPVIVIPGLMGTTLVNGKGEEVWPKSLTNIAFSRYDDIALDENKDIRPGRLFDALAGVDFYGTLVTTLEKAGRYQKGEPGTPVGSKSRRRYYVFLYDWRKSNFDAVNQLHALVEQIRADYGQPDLKVDIIAHSNGGLIARYYLQYGPQDAVSRIDPKPWQEGDARIRRIALLGTPSLGSVISVGRLYQGFRLGLREIPPHILSYFATPFETLPSPKANAFIDGNGTPVALDIFDVGLWHKNRWSVFSDAVRQQVRREYPDAERRLAQLDERFAGNLENARHFQTALALPLQNSRVQFAVFGGDCELTSSRAVVESNGSGLRLAFQESDIANRRRNVDYARLMQAPGDGLVTRESQLARASNIYLNQSMDRDLFPVAQTMFFCEKHDRLTSNPYFQNNLLYFILH